MILFKKALRGILRNRRTYISCVLLTAIGIMTYTAFNSVFVDLRRSQQVYYAEHHFADVFADLAGMPRGDLGQFDDIEGISRYTARLSEELRVINGEANERIYIVVNTYDPGESEPINDFALLSGRRDRGGIILGEDFALAHGLVPGDSIKLSVMGRAVTLPVTGIAGSPEYIYHIRSLYEMLPDAYSYGFAYMDYRDFAPIMNRAGWVDSIGFLLEPGYTYEDVRYAIEDALRPYGLTALTKQADQLSNSMLDSELNSLGSMATALPVVFIGMSVVMLYIMLRRIIGQERTQIGILKAYGHSTAQVVTHYLGYGAMVGFLGGLIGDVIGYVLAGAMNTLYAEFFKLPRLAAGFNPFYTFMGLFIATLSGTLGAFFGATEVLRLSPSEAMRPAAPPPVRFDLLSRMRIVGAMLASTGRMALRSIDRGRFRSAFVALGVCFAFSVSAFTGSYSDMFDTLLFDQFTKVEVYDMKVALQSHRGYGESVEAAWRLPGVSAVEGILEVPAELSVRHRNTGAMLTAIEAGAGLYKLYDSDRTTWVALPPGGLVLSNQFANELEAKVGDIVTLRSPYLPEDIRLPILGIIQQNMGSGCYIELHTLWAIMGSEPVVSGVLLNTNRPDAVKDSLSSARNTAMVRHQGETIAQYEGFLETYMPMIAVMQGIGVVIAFVIINTVASISLSERRLEYATLRVMGMLPGEVGQIIGFEYGLLAIAGMVMGVPFTYWLKSAIMTMMDTEMFTLPLYTPPTAFFQAALGCAVAVWIASRSMRRQVAKFDLTQVLKERE